MSLHPTVGLCATCIHAERIPHPRGGNDYWRCRKAEEDKTMLKYPRLPVLACPAHVTKEE
ncbi:MAG: hypothetical protein HYV27_23410 [Candidatus Hydrogenedentes bacterium]|nr:hypothetical protein [Candidatus Hydrogenedentota bacterium]